METSLHPNSGVSGNKQTQEKNQISDPIERAVKDGKGVLSNTGALIVETGKFTGRAAKFRYLAKRPELDEVINWGTNNLPMDWNLASKIITKTALKFNDKESYTYRGYVGPFSIQVNTFSPWHIAFCENMFRSAPIQSVFKQVNDKKPITIFHDPYGDASSLGFNYNEKTAIIVDPVERQVAIIGTAYAGEIKKSAFGLCNYLLPLNGIFPMHASANCLEGGSESCVLFGLSGTGKTTLSASSDRLLIGDDEIIWTPSGVSNLEGGCYAKLIDLDKTREPQIYHAVNQPGSIMENVGYDAKTLAVDYEDRSKTENTRGSYNLKALGKIFEQDVEAEAPKNIVFLTADAFGALPAVARLNYNQAQYHFMAGYTAKVAGTELGIKEPQTAFSACFGAPFMPRHPATYAKQLMEYAEKSNTNIWLLNTGWREGGYGSAERFPIPVSRRILACIQSGELAEAKSKRHPIFGFDVPQRCPGLEDQWLDSPRGSVVRSLAIKFQKNMETLGSSVSEEIVEEGGPQFVGELVN